MHYNLAKFINKFWITRPKLRSRTLGKLAKPSASKVTEITPHQFETFLSFAAAYMIHSSTEQIALAQNAQKTASKNSIWDCCSQTKGLAAPGSVGPGPDAAKAYPEAPNRVGGAAGPLCWCHAGDPRGSRWNKKAIRKSREEVASRIAHIRT